MTKLNSNLKALSYAVRAQSGFTMIELLIVVAIIALVGTAMMMGLQLHTMKARDSRRKADLEKIKIAFEHYYNDNDCYPPADVFFNGGSEPDPGICNQPLAALEPYLKTVPCDPTTGRPYVYAPPDAGECTGYRIYTKLENNNDASIEAVGCYKNACGTSEPYASNNFAVAVGAAIPEDGFNPGIPALPTVIPTGYMGNFACSPNSDPGVNGGNPYCKEYDSPQDHGCGAAFSTLGICSTYCYQGASITCSD